MSSPATAHFNFWTTIPNNQPSAVFQTVWPASPFTSPYSATVGSPAAMAGDYAGVVVPGGMPHFYNRVTEKPSPNEYRKFFLDRSIFDLLDAHPYLSLTDPKLLGWYLHLSPEDRKLIQDEGGFHQFLQRHPALELSSHHVYVKYNVGRTLPVHPYVRFNEHTSRMSGTKRCGCEMPHSHLDMEMFPNDVREPLTLLSCNNSRDGSQRHPYIHEEICHDKQLPHLHDSLQTAFNSPITQEPNPQRAHKVKQFSGSHLPQLNEEGPSWQMESSSSAAAVCKDRAALACFPVDMELERQGGKPELRSHIAMTPTQIANFTPAEVSPSQSDLPTVEKETPFEDIVDDIVDDIEDGISFENQRDNLHSIMEEDESILVCLATEDVKAHNNEVHSGPVSTYNEAVAASSETLKPNQSVIKMNTAEKDTSPMPCVPTRDVIVGTKSPETSDKHVNTEVHMADLDYLAEEFIKLRMAEEEVREQKKKMKSLGCKLRKECDCIQRAQQAELCLLALQYNMCRQHCWRLYYTSAEGGQLSPLSQSPPANIVSVLQKLESDYNEMKDKILAGLSLEKLQPLSVDSEQIISGASYIPAQIIADVLGNVPSRSSQEPQKPNMSRKEKESPENQSKNGSERKEQIKKNSKARRAVSLAPQDRDAVHNANKHEGKQPSSCKELNTSEAWYDAEEDLEPAGPAAAAEMGQDQAVVTMAKTNESASEEAQSSVLWVSNLPSNVQESDVLLWFKKYQVSEVSISALKNGLRVAVVITSGPQSAEAAVRELNGSNMQGHTLHVEHINKAIGESHSEASASFSDPEYSQDTAQPQSSKTECSSAERKLITQPPLSSSIKIRKVVSIYPTAKGTCVPQTFGTMESFDTLMAELTQRHPDVGRQGIVDALIELKAKHRDVLSSLPLKTISEMTSELLTRQTSAPQL